MSKLSPKPRQEPPILTGSPRPPAERRVATAMVLKNTFGLDDTMARCAFFRHELKYEEANIPGALGITAHSAREKLEAAERLIRARIDQIEDEVLKEWALANIPGCATKKNPPVPPDERPVPAQGVFPAPVPEEPVSAGVTQETRTHAIAILLALEPAVLSSLGLVVEDELSEQEAATRMGISITDLQAQIQAGVASVRSRFGEIQEHDPSLAKWVETKILPLSGTEEVPPPVEPKVLVTPPVPEKKGRELHPSAGEKGDTPPLVIAQDTSAPREEPVPVVTTETPLESLSSNNFIERYSLLLKRISTNLTANQTRVFRRLLEGKGRNEIAAELGVSSSAVSSHLRFIREAVASLVDEYPPEEEGVILRLLLLNLSPFGTERGKEEPQTNFSVLYPAAVEEGSAKLPSGFLGGYIDLLRSLSIYLLEPRRRSEVPPKRRTEVLKGKLLGKNHLNLAEELGTSETIINGECAAIREAIDTLFSLTDKPDEQFILELITRILMPVGRARSQSSNRISLIPSGTKLTPKGTSLDFLEGIQFPKEEELALLETEFAETSAEIVQAFDTFTDTQQRTLLLILAKNDRETVSEKLGMKPKTVYNDVSTIRNALTERLEQRLSPRTWQLFLTVFLQQTGFPFEEGLPLPRDVQNLADYCKHLLRSLILQRHAQFMKIAGEE